MDIRRSCPTPAPEQGQLVNVRSRQWIISDDARGTLPVPALNPFGGQAQHLVSLLSVEDDALGEELQVVWQIEPGAQVVERVALPSRPASIPPTGSTPSSMPSAGTLSPPPT